MAAQAEIRQVQGNDPLVGGKIDTLKDRADEQLSTTQKSYRNLKPLLDNLPAVLGANGPRTYLLTIMNPAEQRYSGGATLQMASIHFDKGAITFGASQSVADVDQTKNFLTWRPVPGNIFHPPGPRRLASATYSPWWQISGEELLRAWQAQTGQRCQGLIAVDLQALAGLFRITGPMQVAGYGELNSDNLVHALVGSYDNFQDPFQRRRLNNALVAGVPAEVLERRRLRRRRRRSLQQDAKGRHVAIYFRDRSAQQAFAKAGFAGNLSQTRHDYLGVFSQNLNGSKADYWQQRHVDMQVALHPDGSANETLTLDVVNASPPYTQTVPDPKSGYSTRWLGTLVSVWFPPGTNLGGVDVDGTALTHASLQQTSTALKGVLDRPVLTHSWLLPPRQSGRLTANYAVPRRRDGRPSRRGPDVSGQLWTLKTSSTRSRTRITLKIPSGFHFGTLPVGWSLQDSHTAMLFVTELTESSSWSVPVIKD